MTNLVTNYLECNDPINCLTFNTRTAVRSVASEKGLNRDERYHARFVTKRNPPLFSFLRNRNDYFIVYSNATALVVLMANVKLGCGPYLLLQRAKLPSRIHLVWGWNTATSSQGCETKISAHQYGPPIGFDRIGLEQ